MPKFVPKSPTDFNDSPGEEAIFRAFAALPPDTWVFHSLRWTGNTRNKPQGEADFVVLSPKHGLLVIEVKSGEIRYENGEWRSTDRSTNRDINRGDPEKQADTSKWHLMRATDHALPRGESCLFGHAVWFPSVEVKATTPLPAGLKREIVFDRTDVANPEAAIARALGYWAKNLGRENHLSTTGVAALIRQFAPTLSLVPSLRDDWADADAKLEQLTSEQKRILEFLDEQRVATIAGSAGTGKTFLAVEKARRLSERGGKTLVLCFNRPLRDFLHAKHRFPNVDFCTLHDLARQLLRQVLQDMNDVPDALVAWLCDDTNDFPYQNVVIDEGQDLTNDVLEWLHQRTDGHFYVFYDRRQHVRRTERDYRWLTEAECRLTLTRNCRNTKHICRTAYRTAGLDVKKAEANVEGEKARLHDCTSDKDARERVARVVRDALAGGIAPEDIAVLTMEAVERGVLHGVPTIAGRPTTSAVEKGKITATSVRRFKGLEAGLVILTDVRLASLDRDDVRALLYVGASRARQQLHLMCMNVDEAAMKVAVTTLRSDKAAGTFKGVERAFDAVWDDNTGGG